MFQHKTGIFIYLRTGRTESQLPLGLHGGRSSRTKNGRTSSFVSSAIRPCCSGGSKRCSVFTRLGSITHTIAAHYGMV